MNRFFKEIIRFDFVRTFWTSLKTGDNKLVVNQV